MKRADVIQFLERFVTADRSLIADITILRRKLHSNLLTQDVRELLTYSER